MLEPYLDKLRSGKTLSTDEAAAAILAIMDDTVSPELIKEFLTILAKRGETSEEISGAAKVLRSKVLPIKAPSGAVDCCGTGGDHSNTYNISTAVAFVAAACGVCVAKHGNRAASSKSGAADVLEALGVNLQITPEQCEQALKKINFCFLMAPHHHHALKPLTALRKELGFRTIFNLLGPLANPATTKYQLVGVFDKKWLRPMAEVLLALGTQTALIVHGSDGLDEITLTGDTYYAKLENGQITEGVLKPDDFGLPYIQADDIIGGDAQVNAQALKNLLAGASSAYRSIVLANTSAVLVIAGHAKTFKEGVALAVKAIDDGSAASILRAYTEFTRATT